jgi:microcompartment protein CcmL/EutN
MAIGGKGFLLVTGEVAAVQSAVDAAAAVAMDRGVLVAKVVIPGPRRELFSEFI